MECSLPYDYPEAGDAPSSKSKLPTKEHSTLWVSESKEYTIYLPRRRPEPFEENKTYIL